MIRVATVGGSSDSRATTIQAAQAATLTLLLVALWTCTHVYKGITGDAELYALQATSRLHPDLATDLYLQNVSQDRFTLFSPVYARFIDWWGLARAALVLSLVSSLTLLLAAGWLARRLCPPAAAWLAVAALILIKGSYGAYGVFSYAENYLTARSVAEALVVVALACNATGRRTVALLLACIALAVHPIMALPGLLVLLCLWLPLRVASIGAVLGIATTVAIATLASREATTAGALTLMDPPWLEVVRERSQFLFLQLWTLEDWSTNIRPLLCLVAYALILDGQARRLCLAALLVGLAGIAVAAIAGLVGPVALLLQGQAWRWLWPGVFVSVLLLAPALLQAWRDPNCGPLIALLLVLGWSFPVMNPVICCGLALFLWVIRMHLRGQSGRYLRWVAAALAAVVVVRTSSDAWTLLAAPSTGSGASAPLMTHLRDILGLGPPAVLALGAASLLIFRARSTALWAALATVLVAGTAFALPSAFKNERTTAGTPDAFADWRAAIPPSAVVQVLPARNSAAFTWFTLERPSYLTVDQSAGVVFSRATALEVKRRSEVLLPLQDPDWRIMSAIRRKRQKQPETPTARPLTAPILAKICEDPVMRFVVAKERLDFNPLRHAGTDVWKDWNLYDCRRVRAPASP